MSAECAKCGEKPGEDFECCIQEEWFKGALCSDCKKLLARYLVPFMHALEPVDTSQAFTYAGRVTRKDIVTGDVKNITSAPDAPLLMSLRVDDGIRDLIGRHVLTKLTEDEVLRILAFLLLRPHWRNAIEAMATEPTGPADAEKEKAILIAAGQKAIAETRSWMPVQKAS